MTIYRFNLGLLAVAMMGVSAPVSADPIALPSGAVAALMGRLDDPEQDAMRLRFVSRQFADVQNFGFARVEGDLIYLCETVALPLRSRESAAPQRVIVSISSQPLAFGETAPNIVQYFDSFQVKGGTCIGEGL